MAATSTPYGLKPINLIGGQAFNGGVIREFVLSDENTYAFYTGAVIQLDSVGNAYEWTRTSDWPAQDNARRSNGATESKARESQISNLTWRHRIATPR